MRNCLLPYLLLWIQALNVQAQPAQQQQDSDDVKRLFTEDQKDRGNDPFNPEASKLLKALPGNEMTERDAQRRSAIRKLLDDGKVKTANDYQFAALVFQHGQSPGDWAMAHILATTSAMKGKASAKWLAAATLDRYLMHAQQAQLFGTQFNRSFEPGAKWTMEPYDKASVPDAVREMWCVIPLQEQVRILEEANAGKPLRGTSAPRCP